MSTCANSWLVHAALLAVLVCSCPLASAGGHARHAMAADVHATSALAVDTGAHGRHAGHQEYDRSRVCQIADRCCDDVASLRTDTVDRTDVNVAWHRSPSSFISLAFAIHVARAPERWGVPPATASPVALGDRRLTYA